MMPTCGVGTKSANFARLVSSRPTVWSAMQRILAVRECLLHLRVTRTACRVRNITGYFCKARHACVSSEPLVCLMEGGEFC